jgi:hypothetical protein
MENISPTDFDIDEINEISQNITDQISKELYFLKKRIAFLQCLVNPSPKSDFELVEEVIVFNEFIIRLLSTKGMDIGDLFYSHYPDGFCYYYYNPVTGKSVPSHDEKSAEVKTNMKKRKAKVG